MSAPACVLLFLLLLFLSFYNGLDPLWHLTLTVRAAVIFLVFLAIFLCLLLFLPPFSDDEESEEYSFLYCAECHGSSDSSVSNCNSERVTLRTK